ncbi:MAG: DUF4249 domain-containing protein [Bacteroidia bacterium]|nr:DUF4249 domain-containing protein [Bacteroidia bacterium]
MLKTRPKPLITIFIVFALCTCIDPYIPELKGYESLLVVDGLLTNENASYEVKLSRTMQAQNSIPEKVSDAVLSITDESGNKTMLRNFGNGLYKTDSTVFTGAAGKTYILHIATLNGKDYQSEPCTMLPVPEIDSLYFEKAEEFTNNQSETHEGIRIYLDSKEGDGINNYFRWGYEETWKFRLPTLKKFNFINDSTILPVDVVKEFCWKQKRSKEILIQSFPPEQAGFIKNVPLNFIGSDQSDRLTIQYSILVKQYSISDKESQFWDNLKKVNESSGDIFGSQPFPVICNISNVHNPYERVLGYFQVSAVSQKRKDITFMELTKLNLPLFHYGCARIETAPEDYACQFCVPPTWDELYKMWSDAKFIFIEPFYDPVTRKLRKLVFATGICSDCELTGTLVKPEYWIDLK